MSAFLLVSWSISKTSPLEQDEHFLSSPLEESAILSKINKTHGGDVPDPSLAECLMVCLVHY